MIYASAAGHPVEGGRVAAFGVGAVATAAHAVLTLRTAGEMGLRAGGPPAPAAAAAGASP